jgi:hypothetical protein
MNDEKDDFLREIDELLGDVDEDPTPVGTLMANGSTPAENVKDIDLELAATLNGLSTQENHQQAAPKPGYVMCW